MHRSASSYPLVLDSPVGRLGIRLGHEAVSRLDYLPRSVPLKAAGTRFEQRIVRAIENYFEYPAVPFALPLELAGTPFQLRVWSALQAIPPGETCTYAGLAHQLDTGARAVGNACRRNPVSIVVPCHRVVAANGMGGYSGRTGERAIWRKHWLLSHEGASCRGLKSHPPTPTISTQPVTRRTTRA
ncbi:MAG: methylated-DNA--[protein]-cysteine S-methyltransferase [Gammaproteobacteria bacterium]|nr:methylated-DNA--[protein]-cysteine S-methyltransferase [Gammaproteobacteria bacterium]